MPLSEAQRKQLNKNGAYWQKRFEALTESQFNKADDFVNQLRKQYAKANKEVSKEVNAWYGKFANNNKITLQEARKLLTSNEMQELKWDLEEYIKKGETLNYSDAWAKQLKNASARVHLSRLEALDLQMRQHCEELYALENEGTKSLLEGVYEDEFYRDAFEVQKGTGVGYTLNKLDAAKVETFVMSPWAADGKTFSDRIWASRANLVNQLRTGLTQALIRGQNPEALIKDITRKFSVRASEASRLVYTETAFFVSAADKASYNELGLEKYQILATLDSKTSAICRDLDGEVFNMSEYKEGITAPPFHPNCRTTTVPYFDDDFDLTGKRAVRGEDGATYTVPANTNYKEWKRAFVDSNKPEKHGFKHMLKSGAGQDVYYNDKADYSFNLEDFSEDVNNAISSAALKVAQYGSENRYEYAAIVDVLSGKEVDFGTSHEYGSVNSYHKFLREHLEGHYIMVHNHNTNSTLSLPDIQELASWGNVDAVVAVSNDGLKSIIVSNGNKTHEYLMMKYEETVSKLRKKGYNNVEIEEEIIKIADKDFSDKGVVIIDGRN